MSDNRLKLVGAAQGFNWLPVYVASELGYFRDVGVEVELVKAGGVDKATRAVADGEVHLAITPPEGAISDHVAGGNLCIFAANSSRLPMSLVARPEVKTIADLRGKRIGTSSLTEGTAIYTQVMLAAHGLVYPGDYEFVLAGIHTARWEALLKGEIDAAPQPAPWNFLAADKGFRLLGEISQAIPEILFGALVARQAWLADNTALVSRLLKALDRAHRFVNEAPNTDACSAIFQRVTIKDDATLARRGFIAMRDLGMWPEHLRVSTLALETTIDLMVRANLLSHSQHERAKSTLDDRYLKAALN
jgi:ABC-type nitrate/sulfonate/bicarbonate transport system substrate-binding protein